MLDNNKPEKSHSSVILDFLFKLLLFYVVSKINRPSKFTTVVVLLIGILFIKSGLSNLQSPDLIFGVALITWVLYRNRYPKEVSPSPIQEITGAFSKIKKEMQEDRKAAEAQGIPIKEYLQQKKYAAANTAAIQEVSLNTLLFGLAILIVFMAVGTYMLKEEWRLNHEFLETTCKILDKQMYSYREKQTTFYRANFYLSYPAENQMITKWTSSTPQSPSTSSYYLADNTLKKFDKGQTYPCWFDPKDPHSVALERGYGFFPVVFFGVPVVVFVLLVRVTVKKYRA